MELKTIQVDGYYLQNCKQTQELIKNGWQLITISVIHYNVFAHFKKEN